MKPNITKKNRYFPPDGGDDPVASATAAEPSAEWADVDDAGEGTPHAGFVEVTVSRTRMVLRVVTEDGEVLRTIHRKPQPAVVRAARGGDAAAVRAALLSPGAGPNARAPDHPSFGSTALHLAAARGHIDVAKELIAGDAHLEMRDADGLTPLDRALQGRRAGCKAVAALIDAELCARAAAAGHHREPRVEGAGHAAEESKKYATLVS